MNVLGHFAALRWTGKKKGDEQLHEVVVVAEHLNRKAADIVETILHEAAHALNFNRGIKDCSASQYHNALFKLAAEELGLAVSRASHYGYAMTSLPEATAARYENEILYLDRVVIHRRSTLVPTSGPKPPEGDGKDPDGGDEEKPKSRMLKAVCGCGFIIRVAKKTMDETTITCGTCDEAFELA